MFKEFINQSNTGAIFHVDTLTFIMNRNEIIAIDHYENFRTPDKTRLSHNLLWCSGQFKTNNTDTFISSNSKNKLTVPNMLYKEGIYIRSWNHGDRIISSTLQKNILLSNLYINNKLSK